MTAGLDGNAVVYCEGAFGTTNGKTAHGLVRRTRRYRVVSVIDSTLAGRDAGEVLDGREAGIAIHADLPDALEEAARRNLSLTHFVMGLAPDGGRLPKHVRGDILRALRAGLHVDSGLHDFLSEDHELAHEAARHRVKIRDVRKPPPRDKLHAFSGRIREVDNFRIALLGTDSAVGKRTTAWILVDTLNAAGHRTELIGTGQTAWMQGARFGIILDSLVNDFVAGELEHAVLRAWEIECPDVMVIEGQGSLMNPAYPGGMEILAATRPHVVVLQHAPVRKEYDGFPGYPIHSLQRQIEAVELLSDKPVVAITVNHEGLAADEIPAVCEEITRTTGRPAFDVLRDGGKGLVAAVLAHRSIRPAALKSAASAAK